MSAATTSARASHGDVSDLVHDEGRGGRAAERQSLQEKEVPCKPEHPQQQPVDQWNSRHARCIGCGRTPVQQRSYESPTPSRRDFRNEPVLNGVSIRLTAQAQSR
jgi:hypothetical protein